MRPHPFPLRLTEVCRYASPLALGIPGGSLWSHCGVGREFRPYAKREWPSCGVIGREADTSTPPLPIRAERSGPRRDTRHNRALRRPSLETLNNGAQPSRCAIDLARPAGRVGPPIGWPNPGQVVRELLLAPYAWLRRSILIQKMSTPRLTSDAVTISKTLTGSWNNRTPLALSGSGPR